MTKTILLICVAVIALVLYLVDVGHILRSLGGRQSDARKAVAQKSGHYADGKFINSLPTRMMEEGSILKSLRLQFFGKERRVPDKVLPTRAGSARDFADGAASGVRAMWIGHATVLAQVDGHFILTDPVWSERASPSQKIGPKRFFDPPISLSDLPPVKVVVVSHDHYDHLDMDTVDFLSAKGAIFVVPLGLGAHLESWEVPAAQIRELNWYESTNIDGLRIIVTPARHYSGRGLLDRDKTLWASFVIEGPNHKIFYSGDSGYFDEYRKIGDKFGPFDLTLIKVGACGPTWPDIHLTPEEAIRVHLEIKGKLLLPVHWGTFNLAFHAWNDPAIRSLKAARESAVTITIPKPGEIIDIQGRPYLDEWWAID